MIGGASERQRTKNEQRRDPAELRILPDMRPDPPFVLVPRQHGPGILAVTPCIVSSDSSSCGSGFRTAAHLHCWHTPQHVLVLVVRRQRHVVERRGDELVL